MRSAAGALFVIAASAALTVSCGKPATPTAPPRPAAELAATATGKIAILVTDVRPINFVSGAPSQCVVAYNVFNNSNYHLYKANASLAAIPFEIAELSANSHYSEEQTVALDPIANSCAGVVDKLMQAGPQPNVTTCTLESVTEGECQSRFAGFVAFDASYKVKVQQAEAVAAKQYADEQAKAFEQEKAQAWAERGAFQFPAGTVLVSASQDGGLSVPAVTAPDFDPTKIDDTTPIATSTVSLCADTVDQNGAATIPNLYTSIVYPDKYGLANWYKFIGRCNKSNVSVLWVKAAAINNLMQAGQISKLTVTH